jgi:hemerythrin-like domain-containing protein
MLGLPSILQSSLCCINETSTNNSVVVRAEEIDFNDVLEIITLLVKFIRKQHKPKANFVFEVLMSCEGARGARRCEREQKHSKCFMRTPNKA